MTLLRIGLILAAALVVIGAVPALMIEPGPDGELAPAIASAILSGGITVVTLALVVPAWRGGRRSAMTIAVLQLVAILPALPAFFLAADLVPAGGVVLAAAGSLLNVVAFTLILLVFSSALLYAAAVVIVVAIYAGLVAAISSLVPEDADRTVQTVAAVVVALSFHPVVTVLRRTVGRSLYGGRIDPAGTALTFGRQLRDDADGPEAALEDARRALRLPGIELLESGAVRTRSGIVGEGVRSEVLAIGVDGRLALRVTLRPGERRLGMSDRAALGLVASPLALLLRSADLTEALRDARAASAESRERERVLMHRELHDGLGPLLTGAVFRADAAHNLLPDRPTEADAALDLARSQIRIALAEVRRVVYGLRPLELEEYGLWEALRRRAQQAGRISVSLALPEPAPELSPAIEVAAYRIVTEALTNVERHSTARSAVVTLSAGSSLEISVADEGVPPPSWRSGVGLASIRDRAEELHGSAEAGPTERGWRVGVTLPLA